MKKIIKTVVKIIVNLLIIGGAIAVVYVKFQDYINNPWTRDGQVRAQVIQVSPRVSGMVVDIAVVDNQEVKKGDLLFEIDPSPYQINLSKSQADLEKEKASLAGKKIEYDRVRKIAAKNKEAISQKDLSRNKVNYEKSLAQIVALKEKIKAAELDLSFTKVYASVDGYVSNIHFQVGSQAVANSPILALVDKGSFWVFGYFRESMIGDIKVGDEAQVVLMAYPDKVLKAEVESIAWGISHSDGNPGENLLPSVKPVFQWIRLAQRIPVRVKLNALPKGVQLRFGLTASVMVMKAPSEIE